MLTQSSNPLAPSIEAVRAFNRFYTKTIGVLGERLLNSPFSLTEMRVLYELAHREAPTATAIARDLALDTGYLSRILERFARRGLVARAPSKTDRRQTLLRLTARGRSTFAPYEQRSKDEVAALLRPLPVARQRKVVSALKTVERALGPAAPADEARPSYRLRSHRPGDMGWVVHRHGAVYWDEWRYNAEFEALVARIVADFLDRLDPKRERCWIAERDGERVGCVFLVAKSKSVAKLRLLLVEPTARGLGLGRQLVDECIRFARKAGYRTITLWTQSELTAARSIYAAAGFTCVDSKPHDAFGRRGLVAETWDLDLSQ